MGEATEYFLLGTLYGVGVTLIVTGAVLKALVAKMCRAVFGEHQEER